MKLRSLFGKIVLRHCRKSSASCFHRKTQSLILILIAKNATVATAEATTQRQRHNDTTTTTQRQRHNDTTVFQLLLSRCAEVGSRRCVAFQKQFCFHDSASLDFFIFYKLFQIVSNTIRNIPFIFPLSNFLNLSHATLISLSLSFSRSVLHPLFLSPVYFNE